jgi:hypothetical protein
VQDVGIRPTVIDELVPDEVPSTQGACDNSKKGLGGVHFVPLPSSHILSLLWRHAWLTSFASKVVSTDNHGGTISNSDLELAKTIAQFDVLAQAFDVCYHTVHNLPDSAATVAWHKRGAPKPRALSPISFASMPSTYSIITTSHSMNSYLAWPMFFLINALIIFTSPIPNSLLISTHPSLRQCIGACSTCEKGRFPH